MKQPKSRSLAFIAKHQHLLALGLILAAAAWFRFWQLSSLPPGIQAEEARIALSALNLFSKSRHLVLQPGLPFIALQGLIIKLMGNTTLALRVLPAGLSLVGVYLTYLWAKGWFGTRPAIIAALLMAVTPWAVTFSRNAIPVSLTLMIVPLLLWTASKAYRSGNPAWYAATVISTAIGIYTDPIMIILPIGLAAYAAFLAAQRKFSPQRIARIIGSATALLIFLLLPLLARINRLPSWLAHLTKLNLIHVLALLVDRLIKTALMFNFYGDPNYFHNLGNQPMLNVFVGVMFILGFLIALASFSRLKFSALAILTTIALTPSLLSSEVPNARVTLVALPLICVLAGIGTGYMLDRWYSTFPINSAARTIGLAAILFLLVLSTYQGYQQYFVAWAKSDEVAKVYQTSAFDMATYLNQNRFAGERYILSDNSSNDVASYFTANHSQYRYLSTASNLPTSPISQQFLIAPEMRVESIEALRQQFPGGHLIPHYLANSSFNESFNIYEVNR